MLEPVTFISPLGTWKMDVEKIRMSSRMMIGDGDDDDDDHDDVDDDNDDGDDDETLRRGCCVKRLSIWREFPLRGREGGVPFSWSFRDKGSSPPLCFAK